MQKEHIIAAIKELAQKTGRFPTMPELRNAFPAINMGLIRNTFGGYAQALREAGFEGTGHGYTVGIDELFRDWARLARALGKVPSMAEYERDSRYSVQPLLRRFRSWTQTPRGLYRYVEQQQLDIEYRDVLDIITAHYKNGPESEWITEAASMAESKARKARVLPDRPLYGPPLGAPALACGPTNEGGRAVPVWRAGGAPGLCGETDPNGVS